MVPTKKRLLTYREVAGILQCSERTLHTLVKTGKIAVVYIGRLVRFTEDAVNEYLHRNTTPITNP